MTTTKNLALKLLLVFVIGIFSLSTNAQKFGYLNTEELILSLPEVEDANKTIEALKDSLTQMGNDMVADLRAKYIDLESRVQEIAPNQLEIEKRKLQEEERMIQNFDQESQQIIIRKSEELLKPIQDKINQAIIDIAKEGEYTYIFDLSMGNVLYADESLDVTEQVKSKL